MSYPAVSNYPTQQLPPLPPLPPEPPEPSEPAEAAEPSPPPHSRRWRIALLATLVVLVLAIPIALFVVLHGDSNTQPAGTPPAAGPSPGVTTSAPAAPSPAAPPAQAAPDGRIPLDQLKNATLDIPAWPTDNLTGPSGKLKFVDGEVTVPPDAAFPFVRHIIIFGATYGDVDRDGAQETLASIGCVVEGGSMQLVAFDRTASGAIVTMGQVVATRGEIRVIGTTDVKVRNDGTIAVKVGDFQGCCGDETPQQWQTRAYGWTGRDFRQTSGPTAFPVSANVTDSGVTAGELVLGPSVNGVRHGTVTVTVTYVRGAKPDHLVLDFSPPDGLQVDGNAWPAVHPGYGTGFWVDLPTPAAGGKVTYTFAFSRPATATGSELGLHLTAANTKNVGLAESNPYDNTVTVHIRSVD
ncbi:hypothetical protein [Dactylosporangium sp. NPDC049140]|uniref:hypothetical protein n=1 Tax=Dactylosporangium sp. NPDC049140 TaxID=3155647 RepID=UPI0033FF2EB2